MPKLTPVDYDPFAGQTQGVTLTPVDYDPFKDEPTIVEKALGAAEALGSTLIRLPANVAASAIAAVKGQKGATVTDKGVLDRYVESVKEMNIAEQRRLKDKYGETEILPKIKITDIGDLSPSLGFSVTAAVPALAAGIATTAATKSPAAGYGTGMATSGAIAYRMAANQIMQEYLEAKNQEKLATKGTPLTKDEEEALKADFSSKATQYGLWEAIPEAIGSGVGFASLFAKLSGIVGKNMATRILTRVTGLYGGELATETITQMGQQRIESEAGLSQEPPRKLTSVEDWKKSLAEIAPSTVLQTTLIGGAAKGIQHVADKRAKAKQGTSVKLIPVDYNPFEAQGLIKEGEISKAEYIAKKKAEAEQKAAPKPEDVAIEQKTTHEQQITPETTAKPEGVTTEQQATPEPIEEQKIAAKTAIETEKTKGKTLRDIFKQGRKTITEQELLQLPDVVSGRITPEDMRAYLETKGITVIIPETIKLETGKISKAYTPQNDEIEVQYAVTDISQLKTSHNEYGNVNPQYPQELQPRARDRAQLSLQVQQMANQIKPELLGESAKVSDGAPIIGSDGIVESGNGRVNAIRLAYQNNKAGHYKQWLIDNAEKFGIAADAVKRFENPVLVRVRITDVDRAEFARRANQADIASMSPAEIARAERGFINVDMLTLGVGRFVEAAKRLIQKVNPEAAKNVAVVTRQDDLGFIKALLASPAKMDKRIRYYVVHGKNAMHKQDRLRGLVNEKMTEIFKPLKDDKLRAEFEALLWLGDAEGKNYTAEELDEMGISPVVKEAYLKQRKFHNQMWRLLSAHRKAYGEKTGYLEGHIPHLFENWNVYELQEEVGDDGEVRYEPVGILGTFRSLREATIYANGLDPTTKYLIKPKTFSLPESLIIKTVLKDASYFRLVESIEKRFELPKEEAFDIVNEIARRKNRRRFLGNVMMRKWQTGFRREDIQQILKEYYDSVTRYVALDDFKARVVPKFEKDFGVELGRADQALRDRNIAKYVQEYINDVNGVPGAVEELIDASIKHYLGSFVRSERPTIWAVNKILHTTAVMKLGLLNLSAGIVNLTQLINTFSKIPFKHFAWGFEHGLKPSDKYSAILRRIGVEFDLGLSDTGGYSMTHRGGKLVRASMIFFHGAEHLNRRITALAAYRYAKKDLGYSEKQALQYAREMVDRTQFDYSVADTAKIFRSPIGRVIGQFKPFAVKQIEFIIGLKGVENIKFWIPMLLLAGTAGIPLIEGIANFIEWITGKDPLMELKAFLMRWAGDDKEKQAIAEIAMYGVASQIGVDVSKRVGIGDVLPRKPSDVLGPTINTLLQAKKIIESGDKTELVRSIAPSIGNLITALEIIKNDLEVRDPYHRQHLKYIAKPEEVAVKGMGLRPLRESKIADIEHVRQYETKKYTRLQRKYLDRAVESLLNGDAEGFAESITKAVEKGVMLDDRAVENEILQRVLPQDLRMILKTRAIQRGDYIETLEFLNEEDSQ